MNKVWWVLIAAVCGIGLAISLVQVWWNLAAIAG